MWAQSQTASARASAIVRTLRTPRSTGTTTTLHSETNEETNSFHAKVTYLEMSVETNLFAQCQGQSLKNRRCNVCPHPLDRSVTQPPRSTEAQQSHPTVREVCKTNSIHTKVNLDTSVETNWCHVKVVAFWVQSTAKIINYFKRS